VPVAPGDDDLHLLLSYGMGAFALWRRSRWALVLAIVVPSINTSTTPEPTPEVWPCSARRGRG
jgi:hypothetical protein